MKILKSILFYLALLSIFINPLKAQTTNSLYSLFGVGQIVDNHYGINRSLGGTGIAFQTDRSVNYLNPASYLGIRPNSFIMELGVYGIYNQAHNSEATRTSGNINFNYLSASFYLTKKWAFSFGLVPFSHVDYQISSEDEIEGETTEYEKQYTGSGGLNRIYFGNAFRLIKGLHFGVNGSYIFGTINQTETALANNQFIGYHILNERRANSFYFDYGLQYLINKKDWQYTIGLIYGGEHKLNTTDSLKFVYNDATTALDQENVLDIYVPQKFGIGLSAKKGRNIKLGIDYELRKWSSIKFSNYNLNTTNSHRISVGFEYAPQIKRKETIFENLIYRIGANYKNSYLDIKQTPVNAIGCNVGIGIPINTVHTLNFSVEYGQEGTTNNDLIKNKYWGFYMSFSLYEFWNKNQY